MQSSTQPTYTTSAVTSKDGTTIGYRQFGHGPGIVVLHGSMSSTHTHLELAGLLADAFTLYVPDRRGRGLSGPAGANYGLHSEVEDVDALLGATGANYVFGVSSGALITLQSALTLPAIQKIAMYEPPFFVSDPTTPTAALTRLDRELAQGKIADALITGMKAAQMGPAFFHSLPNWLLTPMVNMAMNGEAKQGSGDYVSMRVLAPTLRSDFQVVVEMSGKLEQFRALQTPVLLLGGSKSPAYLKAALDALEKTLPNAKRIEFPGLDHGSSGNYDKQRNPGGQPATVAQALRQFFA
jgi:pimeloyl-ACP methyl ester carboxylesterase